MSSHRETETAIAAILRQLSEELNFFPKETAQLMYARQLADSPDPISMPGSDNDKKKAEQHQRLNKMMEEAKLKWTYAGDSQKKNVKEMESVIQEYNDKIKALFAPAQPHNP